MKASSLLLVGALLLCASSAFGQGDDARDRMIQEQRMRDEVSRRKQDAAFARLHVVKEEQKAREMVRRKDGISFRLNPSLTKKDREAIAINPEDTKQFLGLLQQGHTGIVRLQSANVCNPTDKVIQAASGCPDNIAGKATSYSFRTDEYKTGLLADIEYLNNNLAAPGFYTTGIFSNLGDVDINSLGLASNGVRQLAAFVPANAIAELLSQERQMTTGMRIDNYLYRREVALKVNSTYVLRTIAYKGRMLGIVNGRSVNLLDLDTRKDLTLVFRVVREHPDGSVTLVWKQLDVKPSPKIIQNETVVASPKGQKNGK
ncbi:MAG: hypothetical protein QOH96_303 [Blastocatellia bacterium]|nr:hypothetical protein [Blastocatellia bacterium]